jgi:hypothetical protein
MPDGDINDPALKEYNILELAEKQADYYQNRQVREREEREAKLRARLGETDATIKLAEEQAGEDAG